MEMFKLVFDIKKLIKLYLLAKISNTVNVWDVGFGVASADSPWKMVW